MVADMKRWSQQRKHSKKQWGKTLKGSSRKKQELMKASQKNSGEKHYDVLLTEKTSFYLLMLRKIFKELKKKLVRLNNLLSST